MTILAIIQSSKTLALILLALNAVDVISGVIKHVIAGTVNSAKMNLNKKMVMWTVVFAGGVLEYLLGVNITEVVIMYYMATEISSILENAGLSGIPVPASINNVLEQLKDKNGDSDES